MTRREMFSAGAAVAAPFVETGRAAGRPKNVLVIMSDQHKHRTLSIDGEPVARTPNLDAFARTGVRFDNAYCTNPVCVPARMSFLSGLYTHNHEAFNNSIPLPFRVKTMAHAFGAAGYMTSLVGKMHFVDAQTHGFDYRLDFNDWLQYLGPKAKLYADELGRPNSGSGLPQIDSLWEDFGDPWKGARELDDRLGSVHIGRPSKMDERDQFDSFVTRESIRFLKQHGKRQPFLLISSFLKPHDPFMPAQRFAGMFRAEDMKLPPSWKPIPGSKLEMNDPVKARHHMSMYYANLAQMDDCAGRVLAALHESGLEQDTIVLYTSDHGEMLGEHGLWQKFQFYDPSCAVPLIVRAPGVTQPGTRCANLVSHTQVFPTLTGLCGLPTPPKLDGASFAADLREPGVARDRAVYAEFAQRRPGAKYMIRRGDYKLNVYANQPTELFDLRQDPKEMKNLAAEPAYAARVTDLKAQLFAWYKGPELKD